MEMSDLISKMVIGKVINHFLCNPSVFLNIVPNFHVIFINLDLYTVECDNSTRFTEYNTMVF